ncbi:MAG: YecA family protein [Acidimicrobiia bacterium]
MQRDRERLVYLFGEEALVDLGDYDFDDESDVLAFVERYLPMPAGAARDGARAAVRSVAVRQILDDDPPEAWQAVVRMRDAGLDRDAVLGQLAMVISENIFDSLSQEQERAPDPVRLIAALDALPLPSAERIAAALVATARSEPGITVDDHVERAIAMLGSAGSRRIVEAMINRVLDRLIDGPLHWLAGDVTLVFHDTIAGRTFTHQFNDAERELEVLTVSVDLAAYERFDTVRLADGTEIEQFSVERGHLAWSGPSGWLDAFQPGDLLAVSATFDPPVGDEPVEAVITIDVIAGAPMMTDELATALRAAYDSEQFEHGLAVSTEDLVAWLCHHHPDWFTTPLPPLSDWCDAAGLELDGNQVAHEASVWRRELHIRRFNQVMDLVPERRWREVLGRAMELLDDPDASIDDLRTSLSDCAEPETLDVLVDVLIPELLAPEDEFLRETVASPGRVFELVERATAIARRPREVATAQYLACVLHERCGRPLIAAEHLARAVEAQPRLGPIVERMGWYCFDRGDARGAMRWWRELEHRPPAASTIEPFLNPTAGRTRIGRNDPCWCGSGRKFKQCHQTLSELPALPDRVAWLSRKATLWLEHTIGETRALVTDLAVAWVTGDPGADASEVLGGDDDHTQMRFAQAFADPILFDAALHEGGRFVRFLRERGDLLPDDERLLATAWLTVDRSVHEVVSVQPGVAMTLRDLATGDVVDVRERTASRSVRVGERYCARVVPDGASHQILGGVFPVRTGHEQTVLDLCAEADPVAICAWAGALTQPPRIVHRPGMIDSMFDRDAIQSALDGLGDADEASVMAHLNAELSRQAQAQWLVDKIPALGGLTPRQAAADPIGREQLERLLAEFDRQDEQLGNLASGPAAMIGGPITYDTAALRRELGLA